MATYFQTWTSPNQRDFVNLTGVPDYYTHILVAFGCFKGAQVVFQDAPNFDIKSQIAAVQARGKKVLLSMGGWTCDWSPVYSGDATSFGRKAADFAKQYNFDGVDVDFEYMGFKNPAYDKSIQVLMDFIRGLRAGIGADKLLTLTPMPTYVDPKANTINNDHNSFVFVINNITSLLDYIQIMCYNEPDDQDPYQNVVNWGTPFTFSNSQYGSVHYIGFDPKKIVIGLLAAPSSGDQGYLTPDQANKELAHVRQTYGSLAGVMYWSIEEDKVNPNGAFYQGDHMKACVLQEQC